MRPGLLCPGRRRHARRRMQQQAAASMRPGLLCPGRRQAPDRLSGRRWRFNEAGAFMPRKVGNTSGLCLACRSFNEAGAFMPRKER